MSFIIGNYTKGTDIINTVMPIKTQNHNQYFSFMIDKSYLSEYISSNSSQNGKLRVNEELKDISNEDELIVIKYLLEIMRTHDIITEEEYRAVLYKYN